MPGCSSSNNSFRDSGLVLSLTAERGPRALHTLVVNSQNNPPKGGFSIPILQIKKQELNTRPSQLDYQAPGPNIYPTPKSMLYYTI